MISLTAWPILKDVNFTSLNNIDFLPPRFGYLWFTMENKWKQYNNFVFYIWKDEISLGINKVSCIKVQIVISYGLVAKFYTTKEFMYIQAKVYLDE